MKVDTAQNPLTAGLITAAKADDPAAIEDLLRRGADMNGKDEENNTPLMWAARLGRLNTARLLIAQGADMDAQNDFGNTALIWAVFGNHLEVIRLLVDKGADPDKKNSLDKTALLISLQCAREAIHLLQEASKQAAAVKKDILRQAAVKARQQLLRKKAAHGPKLGSGP